MQKFCLALDLIESLYPSGFELSFSTFTFDNLKRT